MIEIRKAPAGFSAIYHGEEEWRVIPSFLVPKKAFPGCLTFDEWTQAFAVWEYGRVKNYVVWLLGRKSYHSQELWALLFKKKVAANILERVISEFKSAGYIDDEAWISSYLRLNQKKYGKRLMLAKLRAKGIEADFHLQKNDEIESIRVLFQSKYRKKDLTDWKTKQKVVASLLRKGFEYEDVMAAIKEV
ncbi:MAG: recombination regulator RecX [Parachlamydia sp.]|jgi:regulatory protein|nr:recombination regulator RecX [Parachlamydia sp.]